MIKDIPVLNWDKSPRDYFAVPGPKELSLMPAKERKEYEAMVCKNCSGKIQSTHKYRREGGLAHVNCPPLPEYPESEPAPAA